MLNDIVKQNGVVYTPDWIVKIILDKSIPDEVSSIAVCDPACGDGAFLVEMAERICKQALKADNPDHHFDSLHALTGFDIDSSALDICRTNLDRKISEYFPDLQIHWRLHEVDGLITSQWQSWQKSFDYVVGNPPYIRIQHLEEDRRELIRRGNWGSLGGCTDIYMLFYEYGLKLLKEGGSLCFITPSSWMKNNAGRSLRKFLNSYDIEYILDFDDYQVFNGFTTYTAITKVSKSDKVKVEKFVNGVKQSDFRLVEYRDKWICIKESLKSSLFLNPSHATVLGDVASIQVGIQTLADKVFILPVSCYENGTVVCVSNGEEVPLELESTKRILKASVMRAGTDRINRVIIFPYDEYGALLSEDELEKTYPLTYLWLLNNKPFLLHRDKGRKKQYQWYEYGRSVGVKTGFGRKILTSGMNRRPDFQICEDERALFYSGYSITPEDWVDVSKLLGELNGELMEEYINSVSKPFRQGWRSYAKSYIQDFPIDSSRISC